MDDNWLTFYTDAAYLNGRACYAGIANHRSGPVLQWFDKELADSSMQAEARAILWALRIAP